MLQITVPSSELWDENTECFMYTDEIVLNLEHSLLSISKWEQIYKKPFLKKVPRSQKENADYIKCMAINRQANDDVYYAVVNDSDLMSKILTYMDDSATATFFTDTGKKEHSSEEITSELIYYWMVNNGIPFECQKWHINRLLALIRICNIKSKPPKKMSQSETYAYYDKLNKARRAKYHTKG